MKMSRIVEELERQGIHPTYENISIYAVFVSEEGLAERLELNATVEPLTKHSNYANMFKMSIRDTELSPLNKGDEELT